MLLRGTVLTPPLATECFWELSNKQAQKTMTSIFFFKPFLFFPGCARNQFQRLVPIRVPVCAAAPSSYSHSSTATVETTALKFSFALPFKNTESRPCKLLHAPRSPPGNPCWRRTGNLAALRQDIEVFTLADKKGRDPRAADLALSSAQRLGNARCRAVKPIVQLQAPGRRVKAPGGK